MSSASAKSKESVIVISIYQYLKGTPLPLFMNACIMKGWWDSTSKGLTSNIFSGIVSFLLLFFLTLYKNKLIPQLGRIIVPNLTGLCAGYDSYDKSVSILSRHLDLAQYKTSGLRQSQYRHTNHLREAGLHLKMILNLFFASQPVFIY